MNNKFIGFILGVLFLTGCASPHLVFDIPVPEEKSAVEVVGSVYIKSITDARKFEQKPRKFETPRVYKKNLDTTPKEELAPLFGVQLSDYHLVMETYGLPEGETVHDRVRSLVSTGFQKKGYEISENADSDIIVDIVITDFWSWNQPSVFTTNMKAKVSVDMTVKRDEVINTYHFSGYGSNQGQNFGYENWRIAFKRAYNAFLQSMDSTKI